MPSSRLSAPEPPLLLVLFWGFVLLVTWVRTRFFGLGRRQALTTTALTGVAGGYVLMQFDRLPFFRPSESAGVVFGVLGTLAAVGAVGYLFVASRRAPKQH